MPAALRRKALGPRVSAGTTSCCFPSRPRDNSDGSRGRSSSATRIHARQSLPTLGTCPHFMTPCLEPTGASADVRGTSWPSYAGPHRLRHRAGLRLRRLRARRRPPRRAVPADRADDDRRRRARRVLVGNTGKALKATLAALPGVLKGSKYTKALYMELMALLYDILQKVRKEGLMSIENDVEDPRKSALFPKYPAVAQRPPRGRVHHRLPAPDGLRQPERARDREPDGQRDRDPPPRGARRRSHAIPKVADGLPAFGIVAAVLGVVHTMGSVGLPPAELGG